MVARRGLGNSTLPLNNGGASMASPLIAEWVARTWAAGEQVRRVEWATYGGNRGAWATWAYARSLCRAEFSPPAGQAAERNGGPPALTCPL